MDKIETVIVKITPNEIYEINNFINDIDFKDNDYNAYGLLLPQLWTNKKFKLSMIIKNTENDKYNPFATLLFNILKSMNNIITSDSKNIYGTVFIINDENNNFTLNDLNYIIDKVK
jgi:hypothetical protein